ncbi:2-dehydropantoate 2-reductase [Exophiala aquamarina CBS 119918]|uniref:2-dehydropantoate 2-reductase n=1 Tax=Exophiala aquamarina CBS 119918 TaxID=1182545 RepID=A0A072Q3H7_9EURO|nr:2-dehydropantoate 2-reductase [Exophiala aquamarina CBS 119918]KEF62460.1 2-dehydropantoate 2-reductase [Exophiala aquamarina CBS 119918]
MAQEIKVMLYGLGAIGSFYAFILQRDSRVRLTVVARSNYEAVHKDGIRITSMNHGKHHFKPVKVVRTPAEAGETYDYIVLANKAIDQESVPERIAPAVDENKTTIVIAQNGVGNEDPFRAAFPKNVILSCVVWVGAGQSQPGIIEHRASENTEIGIFPNEALEATFEKAKLDEFTSLLSAGKTPFTVEENIQIQRWEKVVWNCAWNSLTTLTMLDTHAWLKSSDTSTPMTRTLMREVIDVGRKAGVPLEYKLIDTLIDRILAMTTIGSSMQVDCKAGRQMEVDIILGTPYKKGKQLGVPTPTLDVLYTLLLAVNTRMKA